MRISAMPAQVFRRKVVDGELMASAVTSEMESQQVELMPGNQNSFSVVTTRRERYLREELYLICRYRNSDSR